MRARSVFRDPAWVLVALVCGAAILSILAMAATRFLLPSERAAIPTGDWPWTSEGVGVTPLTADSPFAAGDVVVAIDGRPVGDWVAEAIAPPWLVGAHPLGTSIHVDAIRAGSAVSFDAPVASFPGDRLGGAPLGLVAFGASALVLAFALLVRRPQAVALRLIVLGVTCDVADIVAWETGLQPTDFVARTPFLYAFALAPVFSILFWSSLIHLLSIYPVRARWLVARPRGLAIVYGAPLLALVVGTVVAAGFGGGTLAWLARLGPLTASIVSVLDIAVLVAIVAGYRRTPAPRRSQVRLIAITLFVAAAAILVLVSGPIALSLPPLASRGTIALLALPVVAALALAVVRDHLFQVDLLTSSRTRIVAAREEERLRLRRELHDGLGPTLAALGLKVDAARERATATDPAATVELLDEVRADLRSILARIRGLARDLRPPTLDSLGLAGAARQQIEALGGPGGPVVELRSDELGLLPPGVEVAAFRIVVEAVSNVIRHADARRADVSLKVDGTLLRIEVIDDGTGIPDGSIGVGTRAMYERAAEVGGELTIEAGHPAGTRVIATLPIGRREASRGVVAGLDVTGAVATRAAASEGVE